MTTWEEKKVDKQFSIFIKTIRSINAILKSELPEFIKKIHIDIAIADYERYYKIIKMQNQFYDAAASASAVKFESRPAINLDGLAEIIDQVIDHTDYTTNSNKDELKG